MRRLADAVLGTAGTDRLRCLVAPTAALRGDRRDADDPTIVVVSGVNVRTGPNGESDIDLALNKRQSRGRTHVDGWMDGWMDGASNDVTL